MGCAASIRVGAATPFVIDAGPTQRKTHVFLGGACNPTTWRQQIAMRSLATATGCLTL